MRGNCAPRPGLSRRVSPGCLVPNSLSPASPNPGTLLAQRHVGYGVLPAHHDRVGTALLWTLEKSQGNQFTPALRDAWAPAKVAKVKPSAGAATAKPGPQGIAAGSSSRHADFDFLVFNVFSPSTRAVQCEALADMATPVRRRVKAEERRGLKIHLCQPRPIRFEDDGGQRSEVEVVGEHLRAVEQAGDGERPRRAAQLEEVEERQVQAVQRERQLAGISLLCREFRRMRIRLTDHPCVFQPAWSAKRMGNSTQLSSAASPRIAG